jgi:hypothetical protein
MVPSELPPIPLRFIQVWYNFAEILKFTVILHILWIRKVSFHGRGDSVQFYPVSLAKAPIFVLHIKQICTEKAVKDLRHSAYHSPFSARHPVSFRIFDKDGPKKSGKIIFSTACSNMKHSTGEQLDQEQIFILLFQIFAEYGDWASDSNISAKSNLKKWI